MLVDIVILPPKSVRQRLNKLSYFAAQRIPAQYVVDNIRLISHVSLFHLNIKKSRLPILYTAVNEIISEIKPFNLHTKDFHLGKWGYELRVNKPPELVRLNRAAVNKCAVLRDGNMPWQKGFTMTPAQRLIRNKYGTSGTVVNFNPHLTLLAKYLTKVPSIKLDKKIKPINFCVKEIAVCQVNSWYQVTKILKRFRVK